MGMFESFSFRVMVFEVVSVVLVCWKVVYLVVLFLMIWGFMFYVFDCVLILCVIWEIVGIVILKGCVECFLRSVRVVLNGFISWFIFEW